MTPQELVNRIADALRSYEPDTYSGKGIYEATPFGSFVLVRTYSSTDNANYIIRIERA